MTRRFLLTSFSPAMLAGDTANYDVQLDRVEPSEARAFMLVSGLSVMVYQKPMADHIKSELDLPFNLPLSRSKVALQCGDQALIASYHGPRFDGCQPLPDDTRLSYWRVGIFEGELEAA